MQLMGLPSLTPSLLTSNLLPFTPDLPTYALQLGRVVGGALLLTGLAYLGTLYSDYCEKSLPAQRYFRPPATRLEFLRNFVVGPTTEELVFRSCMLATLQFGGANLSRMTAILTTPLYFGLAHLHHAYELYRHDKTPKALQRACLSGGSSRILTTVIQFAYTTVFGWYADYLFVRTGTLNFLLQVRSWRLWRHISSVMPWVYLACRTMSLELHLRGVSDVV